jgi:uncharacterized protein (DUF433 family)
MRTATEYPHIEKDETGKLFIKGTPYKLLVLLRDHTAWGWDAAQIQRQHSTLTLAQAHALLEYYYDHKAELDAAMAGQDRKEEEIRASMAEPGFVERLRKLRRERNAVDQAHERGTA